MTPMFYDRGNGYNYQNNNGNLARGFFLNDAGPYTPILRFLPYNPYSYYQSVPNSIHLACRSELNNKNYKDREISLLPKREIHRPSTNGPTKTESSKTVTNPQKPVLTHSKSSEKSSITQKELASLFIQTAEEYITCNEKNGSHHKFCVNPTCKTEDPYDQEWCTDYVTYVVKASYKKAGRKVPTGFGDHDVERMKKWAERNGYFIRTTYIADKSKYTADNIRKGDIIILNENGASHIGFVTGVDENGTIRTIEGNRDDKVSRYSYSPEDPDISGFIRLEP